MQEDYFLESAVDTDFIGEIAELMQRDSEIAHVGLTHFGSSSPFEQTKDPRLWRISRHANYRISCQAALWRREKLATYLKSHENGWMFELFGTLRSWRRDDLFLTVNREMYGGDVGRPGKVIPYRHAGIVKGKWHPAVADLFARERIQIDFQKRGFYRRKHKLVERVLTARKLAAHPRAIVRSLAEL